MFGRVPTGHERDHQGSATQGEIGPHRNASVNVVLIVLLALVNARPSHAGTLSLRITANRAPVAVAVASLHSPQAAAATRPGSAVIDQRDIQFTPRVTVIGRGSQVRFPNSENVRHQVYSFSPSKRFELPLYSGKRSEPVTFDSPGMVEPGCNIHEWMVAYVIIQDAPYFGMTDATGRIAVEAPPGRYLLHAWHAGLPPGSPRYEVDVVVGEGTTTRDVELQLATRIEQPSPGDERLRALRETFRTLKKNG